MHISACQGALPAARPSYEQARARPSSMPAASSRSFLRSIGRLGGRPASRRHRCRQGRSFVHGVLLRGHRDAARRTRSATRRGDSSRRRGGYHEQLANIQCEPARAGARRAGRVPPRPSLRVAVTRGELRRNADRLPAVALARQHRRGFALAEICMGGLGTVTLASQHRDATLALDARGALVRSRSIACLGSQYAGWQPSDGKGKDAFFALGSGPARALARRSRCLTSSATATSRQRHAGPGEPTARRRRRGRQGRRRLPLTPDRLTLIYAPTQQPRRQRAGRRAGARGGAAQGARTQVPAGRIVDGLGDRAALARRTPTSSRRWAAPTTPSSTAAACTCSCTGPAGGRPCAGARSCRARALARLRRSPSPRSSSASRATSTRSIPMLFSPAEVIVTAIDSGESFHAGARRSWKLLDASFG